MKQLFVSLYLLLSLSFLGIGWALNTVWQHYTDNGSSENASLVVVAQLLSQLPEKNRITYLNKINSNPDFPLTLLNANQVTLTDKQPLTHDNVIVINKTPTTALYFIAVGNNQVLIAGPLKVASNVTLRRLFYLFFLLSLACIIFFWIWSLSTDLNTLKLMLTQFGLAKWDTRISTYSHLNKLAIVFNEMANNISHIIDTQTHLLNAVSHEIRTPLSRLKFALALMSHYSQSQVPNYHQLSDNINQDINEIEALLEELLSYTSLDPQYDLTTLEHCELHLLIEKTINRLQVHHPIPITFIPYKTGVVVKANASLIDRALQNLITNAQRFGRQSIIVSLKSTKQEVHISVLDDGEGIPSQDEHKIFEPFYQSQNTHKDDTRGHGLGLAIVKRIMEKHHGSVTFHNHQNVTTFTLTLPKNKD